MEGELRGKDKHNCWSQTEEIAGKYQLDETPKTAPTPEVAPG